MYILYLFLQVLQVSLLHAEMQLQCRVQNSCLTATASVGDGKPSTDLKAVVILCILKGGSNPTRNAPTMMALNKLSFLCLAVPMVCVAGKWERSWELEAAASWCVTSPPWSQPTFLWPFPPPAPQKQHPSEREDEQEFSCSLCGYRLVTNPMERTYFLQAAGLCPMQQL